MNPYDFISAASRTLLTHYPEDLVIDEKQIAQHPGVPFLHWTRKCGTTMAFLFPSDWEGFPDEGETVPYLFGQATRSKLLDVPYELAAYYRDSLDGPFLTQWYDGRVVRQIDEGKAVDVADAYRRNTGAAWKWIAVAAK